MRAITIKQAGWIGSFLLLNGCVFADRSSGAVAVEHFLLARGGVEVSSVDQEMSVDIIDNTLDGKVVVERVGSDVGDNKLLSVFAGLKNKTGHQLDLQVQTIYKDTFGNALNAGSWISFTLKPHESREYHSSAISVQAVDFLVRVRRAPPAAGPVP